MSFDISTESPLDSIQVGTWFANGFNSVNSFGTVETQTIVVSPTTEVFLLPRPTTIGQIDPSLGELPLAELSSSSNTFDPDINQDSAIIPNTNHVSVYTVILAENGQDFGTLSHTVRLVPATLLGDCNLDGEVNFLDIAAFISILVSNDYLEQADLDQNESVDFLDISPFIDLLSAT